MTATVVYDNDSQGVTVNYAQLSSEPQESFLAVNITPDGQKVVARSADINELVRMMRAGGFNDAIITTSGKGVGDSIF